MAWFRRMGVDEVAYHQATVVGRGDDHPGQALDYYGSRGETPLRWGGAGAERLGLRGEVTPAGYEAAFGPGGFRDPLLGRRLVSTQRPGFELVVSAHKSVAVLGVLGRGRGDALDPRCRDDRHDGLARRLVPGTGRPPRPGPGPHRHQRADLRRHPPRHLAGRGPLPSRPCPGGERRGDARHQRRAQGPRQRRPARHRRGRHHGRPTPLRGPGGRAGVRDRAGPRAVGEPAALADRRRSPRPCATCTPSGPTRSTPTSPKPATPATGPAVSPPATPARVKRNTGVDELLPHWQAELEQVGWSVERLAAALEHARTATPQLPLGLTGPEIDALAADVLDTGAR